jgi:2-methylcitrate dehydratase PrpD
MEFCLASILLLRRAGLAEFTDEVVNRPDIQEAISRIDYTAYSDKEAAENDYKPLTSFLDVVLKDGRRISARADVAKGHPSIPMTEDDVVNKFRECAAFASWPEDRSEKIIKAILELEKLARMADLTALLRRAS